MAREEGLASFVRQCRPAESDSYRNNNHKTDFVEAAACLCEHVLYFSYVSILPSVLTAVWNIMRLKLSSWTRLQKGNLVYVHPIFPSMEYRVLCMKDTSKSEHLKQNETTEETQEKYLAGFYFQVPHCI